MPQTCASVDRDKYKRTRQGNRKAKQPEIEEADRQGQRCGGRMTAAQQDRRRQKDQSVENRKMHSACGKYMKDSKPLRSLLQLGIEGPCLPEHETHRRVAYASVHPGRKSPFNKKNDLIAQAWRRAMDRIDVVRTNPNRGRSPLTLQIAGIGALRHAQRFCIEPELHNTARKKPRAVQSDKKRKIRRLGRRQHPSLPAPHPLKSRQASFADVMLLRETLCDLDAKSQPEPAVRGLTRNCRNAPRDFRNDGTLRNPEKKCEKQQDESSAGSQRNLFQNNAE